MPITKDDCLEKIVKKIEHKKLKKGAVYSLIGFGSSVAGIISYSFFPNELSSMLGIWGSVAAFNYFPDLYTTIKNKYDQDK